MHDDADAIAVYNEHVTVITEIKRSQWQVTNYLIALYAGVLAFQPQIKEALPVDDFRRSMTIFLPVLVWVVWVAVFVNLHTGLLSRRKRIKAARRFLSQKAQDVYGGQKGEITFWSDWTILSACLGVTGLAALLTAFLLAH